MEVEELASSGRWMESRGPRLLPPKLISGRRVLPKEVCGR